MLACLQLFASKGQMCYHPISNSSSEVCPNADLHNVLFEMLLRAVVFLKKSLMLRVEFKEFIVLYFYSCIMHS